MYLRVAVSGHLKQLLLRPLGLRCLMLMWQVQRQLQMRRRQQRLASVAIGLVAYSRVAMLGWLDSVGVVYGWVAMLGWLPHVQQVP